MKKLISILLVAIMAFSTLPMVAVASETETAVEINQDNVADFLSEGKVTLEENTKYVLTGPVDLSEIVTTAQAILISDGAELDGAGHALTTSTKGAFINIVGTTQIKNISIGTETNPIDVSGGFHLAVISGNTESTWTNVDFYVENDCTKTGNVKVGAFAQSLVGNLTFDNCTMTTDITLSVGSTHKLGWIGSIEGAGNLTFRNCATYGELTTDRTGFVSAYVGIRDTNATAGVKFENCVNYADVNGKTTANAFVYDRSTKADVAEIKLYNCVNYADISASDVAGMVTLKDGATAEVEVNNCMNLGKISATTCGNIVGTGDVTVNDSYAFGTATKAIYGDGTVSGSGNRTLDTYTDAQGAATMSVADAIAALNAYGFKLGNYVLGTKFEAGTDTAHPIVRKARGAVSFGCVQNTEADENNLQSVRLVGVIDSLEYDYVGFIYTTKAGDTVSKLDSKQYCTKVYTSIIGGGETYTARNFGGAYLFALAIDNVPTNKGTVTIEVTTFAVKGEEEILDTTYIITYVDGEVTNISAVEVEQ